MTPLEKRLREMMGKLAVSPVPRRYAMKLGKAAYRAGQRDERARCAKICRGMQSADANPDVADGARVCAEHIEKGRR